MHAAPTNSHTGLFGLLAGQRRNIYIRKQTKLLTQFFSPIEAPLKCAEKAKARRISCDRLLLVDHRGLGVLHAAPTNSHTGLFGLLAGQRRNIYIRKQTKLLTQFFSPIEPPLKCAEKTKARRISCDRLLLVESLPKWSNLN